MGIKRIIITPGEPAGIGPDITVQIAQLRWPVEVVVIGDPSMLMQSAKLLNLSLELLPCHLSKAALHPAQTLKIIPLELNAFVTPGQANLANAQYVITSLTQAADLCLAKEAAALVTGPVNKAILNQAGIPFMGHTEFLAHHCRVATTVMLFVVNQLKVALTTTHLPLAKVPAAITADHLRSTLKTLHQELKKRFHIHSPRILVCGLNPHAGEGGFLGDEEVTTITPVIKELQQEHFDIEGPLSADTIFTPTYLSEADAILAMYHDQALPVIKYAGFGEAVNVTLGLPFVRTSVDHGTALPLAGTGKADAGSMKKALELAIELIK